MSTIRTFAAFRLVAMDVGNDGVGGCSVILDAGFVRSSILISVRTGHVCICPKFNLEAENQWQLPCRGGGTHVKDTKNSVEV